MKRYIRAAHYLQDAQFELQCYKKLADTVYDIANDAYSRLTSLSDDDPRADYFVSNVATSSKVEDAISHLIDSIQSAVDNQMRY